MTRIRSGEKSAGDIFSRFDTDHDYERQAVTVRPTVQEFRPRYTPRLHALCGAARQNAENTEKDKGYF